MGDCKSCGREIDNLAVVCRFCGTEIIDTQNYQEPNGFDWKESFKDGGFFLTLISIAVCIIGANIGYVFVYLLELVFVKSDPWFEEHTLLFYVETMPLIFFLGTVIGLYRNRFKKRTRISLRRSLILAFLIAISASIMVSLVWTVLLYPWILIKWT